MLKDVYGGLQTNYQSDSEEEEVFLDVMDADGDGNVTKIDFE